MENSEGLSETANQHFGDGEVSIGEGIKPAGGEEKAQNFIAAHGVSMLKVEKLFKTHERLKTDKKEGKFMVGEEK